MGFKIETEIKFDKRITKDDINRGQKKLVTLVKEKSDPYVPFLTGSLRSQVTTSKYIITYKAFNGGLKSYARKQYIENRGMGKEGMNGGGGKRGNTWTERMWAENQDAILEEIKNTILRDD